MEQQASRLSRRTLCLLWLEAAASTNAAALLAVSFVLMFCFVCFIFYCSTLQVLAAAVKLNRIPSVRPTLRSQWFLFTSDDVTRPNI